MDQDALAPGFELHDMSDFGDFHRLRSASQIYQAHHLQDRSRSTSSRMEEDDNRSRPQSPFNANEGPLLQTEQAPSGKLPLDSHTGE